MSTELVIIVIGTAWMLVSVPVAIVVGRIIARRDMRRR
jgi:type IV secretory pathway VirB3-like protein